MVCRPSVPTRSGRCCTTRVGVGRRAGPGAIPAWSCANANGAWSWSATLMRLRKKADRAGLLGFKRSSQHLDGGGCDEGWETALGSGTTSRVAAVARPTRRGAAGEPAAVLGGDCGGSVERGRGDRGRRVARGGGPLVPGGGRDVTQVAWSSSGGDL